MSVPAGTRLGPYEIVAPIGAGGMGEVLRARDTRLDRTVAVKILPAHLSSNPQLRERFDREARAIAALAHPHICSLYDVGHQDGIDYLVMEYLEGESLADRLAKGPLPLDQAIRCGVEIASALEKAHRAGIVHRDLKPGNIMLTRSGAKLLDFGLAKFSASQSHPDAATAALTHHKPLTEEGSILGTFQYMAPEQVEGGEADHRTDIFALGAVLYEMATGRRAFAAKSKASLIASILDRHPPPISTVQPLTPPAFERVVRICLGKDPDERWQSAHDVAEELRWISEGGSEAGAPAPLVARRKSRERLAWTVAALLAAALAGTGAYIATRDHEPARALSFTLPTTTKSHLWGNQALISPDGTMFAFSARKDTSSPRKVWIRPLGSFEPRALDGTENASNLAWSEDSRWILFSADRKLKRISVDGGAAETIADRASTGGAAMNTGGTVLFAPDEGGLFRVAKGSAPEQITTPDRSRHELAHVFPHFLPDGERFLFIAYSRDPQRHRSHLYAGRLGSKEVKFLGEIPSFVHHSAGHLLFVREGSLVAAPFDVDELAFTGEAVTIVDGVFYFKPAAFAGFSASRNGIVTYFTPVAASSLVWLDRSGRQLGAPVRTNESFGMLRIGKDGTRATVAIADAKIGTTDIWSLGLTRPTATRLTFDDGWEDSPVFTPDGTRMFYASDRVGIPDVFVKQLGTAGEDRTILVDEGEQIPTDVSPDGKYLIYESDRYDATRDDIWILRVDGSEKPRPFVQTPFQELGARISPDGKWLAYVSNESGRNQVYARPFPGPGEARQVSTVTGTQPRWSPDSRSLYFREWNKVMVANIDAPDADPQFLFEPDRELGNIEVAPDGKRFLVDLTDKADTQQPTRVIVNWPAMIGKGGR